MDYHIYVHYVSDSALTGGGKGGGGTSISEPLPEPAPKYEPGPLPEPPTYTKLDLDDTADNFSFVATFSKTLIAIAVAKKALQVATQAMSVGYSVSSQMSGDYRGYVGWTNLTQSVNNLMHPVSTIMNMVNRDLQYRNEALNAEQRRMLLGDSAINAQNWEVV